MSNLLVNAIKHARASQVSVRAESGGNGTTVRFTVTDDGVGIEPQALQAHRAVLRGQPHPDPRHDRSGLTICASMAAALGAVLVLDSRLGTGTSVMIDLPVDSDRVSAGG